MTQSDPETSSSPETPEKAEGKSFTVGRLIPIAVLAIGLGLTFFFDLHHLVSFDSLKENRGVVLGWRDEHFALSTIVFVLAYSAAIAISLPGAIWMTIAGGFMFGAVAGGILVVIGATIGATIIFLAARYAFADYFHSKVSGSIRRMEEGFWENALSYMLVLRLVPLFPFWLVNLVPAFLGVSTPVFVLSTFFGIMPGTFVYASLGNGVGHIIDQGGVPDLGAIWNPQIILPLVGLAALALIPPVYRFIKSRRQGLPAQ